MEVNNAGGTQPMSGKLTIDAMPSKTSYKPGEPVTYVGAKFYHEMDGDVSMLVDYSMPEGTAWPAGTHDIKVTASYTSPSTGEVATAEFALVKSGKMIKLVLAVLASALIIAAAVIIGWSLSRSANDTSMHIFQQGDMTKEEAQAMLDEQTESSRIQVSLRPEPELKGDQLHVNFVVVEPNNGFAERLEIRQGDRLVYESDVIQPGNLLAWATAPTAQPGPAVATIYAVGEDGHDSGFPVSVEIEIVAG